MVNPVSGVVCFSQFFLMQIFKIVWLEFQWILAELKWICFNELNAYPLYNLQK